MAVHHYDFSIVTDLESFLDAISHYLHNNMIEGSSNPMVITSKNGGFPNSVKFSSESYARSVFNLLKVQRGVDFLAVLEFPTYAKEELKEGSFQSVFVDIAIGETSVVKVMAVLQNDGDFELGPWVNPEQLMSGGVSII